MVRLGNEDYEVWWPTWRGYREAVVLVVRCDRHGRPVRRMLARNSRRGWHMDRKVSQVLIDDVMRRASGGAS